MNKMTMLLGLLVAIMSVSAFGAGFIGTPTAELDQGQWNVGFNYMYSDMDLDKTDVTGSWQDFALDGTPTNNGTLSSETEIDDVKTQRYYGTIGYGITDSWEAYIQLGIADVKAETKTPPGDFDELNGGTNFDNDFAYGWGTRYTFHEQNNVRWGASVQMNWLDASVDFKSAWPGGTEEQQIDWETYDLIIAVGPTVDMGGWNLYGGPFYYMLDGDLDMEGSETWPAGYGTWEGSGDLEADSIGGFVGAQCTLMEKYDMTTELSFTGDGWSICAGIAMPF